MDNQIDNAERSTLTPIVYFDIFNYPLTLMEVWQYSFGQAVDLNFVVNILAKLKEKKIIESREGFFYLKNKSENISIRRQRYLLAERKFKKAVRFIKLLRFVPGIRAIGICNTLAHSNSLDKSDIDFFIIAQAGKIWSVRWWSIILAKFFGGRPAPGKIRDTICLSFFITEDNLDLEKIIYPTLKEKWYSDIYLLYWINGIIPLYDEDDLFEKFKKANNWIKDYLPNSFLYDINNRRKVIPTWKIIKWIINFILGNRLLELFYKKYQQRIIPKILKDTAEARDTRVVINDQMLKFHSDDKRLEFADKFNSKISNSIYES